MSPEVETKEGALKGYLCSDGQTRRFLGIPYAAPPVGELRWRPPQPVEPWNGVRDALKFGSAAPQMPPKPTSIYFAGDENQDEDCLTLNVWTGSPGSDARPVMVWFHYGAFQNGSAANSWYDGEHLAAQGVTVVTVNYRLGRLGFLAHPELSKESEHGASGNYGLMDQIAALRWVQRNIRAFGGDPDNVTVFGVSAGAHSVYCLRTSPLADGIFHRAIAESGVGFLPPLGGFGDAAGMQTLEAAERTGLEVMELVGAKSVEELRTLPLEQLLGQPLPRLAGPWEVHLFPGDVSVSMSLFDSGYPVIDGYVLPEAPVEAFRSGRQIDVPMIAGSAGNESSGLPAITDPATYESEVEATFPAGASEILALYPAEEDSRRSSGRMLGDRIFTWANWTAGRLQAESKDAPVYYYRFLHEPPLPPDVEIVERENAGAFHAGELSYVFGTFKARDWPWQGEDLELGRIISSYWVNFAKTGDPNGPGVPEWPRFDPSAASTMTFLRDARVDDVPDREEMELWDRIYADWCGAAP